MFNQTLTLLRGAPGSGKSTWVAEHGLEAMTLSFDTVRFALCPQTLALDGDPSPILTATLGKAAINATMAALEERLRLGQSVILDNTNLSPHDQQRSVYLAQRYGATCQMVLFQEGLTADELHARNEHRAAKRLDPHALDTLIARGDPAQVADGVTVVSPEEVIDALYARPLDLNTAERVIVVGDVHSHSDQLQQAVAELDHPEAVWVFLGDLFDRGPDPAGVWHTIEELRATRSGAGEVFLLRGNHDWHLERSLRKNADVPPATATTREQLTQAGITHPQIRDLTRSLRPYLILTLAGRHYVCTHGGVLTSELEARWDEARGAYHLGDVPAHVFVFGTSARAETYRGKSSCSWSDGVLAGRPVTRLDPGSPEPGEEGAAEPSAGLPAPLESGAASGDAEAEATLRRRNAVEIIQLHGHRNGDRNEQPRPALEVPGVVNLEGGVTSRGSLRVAVLGDGPDVVVREYAAPLEESTPASAQVLSLVSAMSRSEDVRARDVAVLSDGTPVVAYNFTRKAFQHSDWPWATRAARGLFVAGDRIVARGYEKFFHLGEPHGYTLEQVLTGQDFAGKVTVSHKANGYLALVASVDGHLVVCSKAGPTPYAQVADTLLDELIGAERRKELRQVLERRQVTLALEVIHHLDPHVIVEKAGDTTCPDRLIALDCIANEPTFALDEEATTEVLGVVSPVITRTPRRVVPGGAELRGVIAGAQADPEAEGVVLRGPGGAMAKVKSDRYRRVKEIRGLLQRPSMTLERLARLEPELAAWVASRGGIEAVLAEYAVDGFDGRSHLDTPRLVADWETFQRASEAGGEGSAGAEPDAEV